MRARTRRKIAAGPESVRRIAQDKRGGTVRFEDEGPVGQVVQRRVMAPLAIDAWHCAGGVQVPVETVDRALDPGCGAKGVIGAPPAFGTGPVTGGKSHRLVMEEQLRIAPRRVERCAPALEGGQAENLAFVPPAAPGQGAARVVQAAAIAQDAATGRVGHDLAGGQNAVLPGHQRIRSAPSRRITSPLR